MSEKDFRDSVKNLKDKLGVEVDTDQLIIDCISNYISNGTGGSFATSLCVAYGEASPSNRKTLENAFSGLFLGIVKDYILNFKNK